MKKMIRLFLICALTALVSPSCINEESPSLDDVVRVGDVLPDFSVTMNDGRIVTGAELRETPSVILFFHSSCPDCRQALPSLQRLYDEYASQGVGFALISRAEESATIDEYWQACGFTMAYSAQKDRAIYELFAKSRVPRVYISDDSGRVRSVFTDNPVPTYDDLVTALSALL